MAQREKAMEECPTTNGVKVFFNSPSASAQSSTRSSSGRGNRGPASFGALEAVQRHVPVDSVPDTVLDSVTVRITQAVHMEAAVEGAHRSGRVAVRADSVHRAPPVAVDMTVADSDTESVVSLPHSLEAEGIRSADNMSLPRQGEESDMRRAIVMRNVPVCFRGPYRAAMRVALVEATFESHVQRARGWKLFLLLPRMSLSRPPRGGLVSQEKLRKRFELLRVAGGRNC